MDEFLIELQAKLNEAKSKDNINSDIDKIQSQVDKLKIQAEIDPKTISNLVNQLETVLNQKINISNININPSQVSKQANQTGQQIGQNIDQGISESLLRGKFTAKFKESFKQTGNAAKDAQKYFQKLLQTENATVSVLERFDDSKLNSFTVNVKRASGEVESLHYQLRNLGTDDNPNMQFKFTGGNTNDASAIKQIKDIKNAFSDYSAKLSQFKSTNSEILSGLTTPLSDFETKLAGLKNGTSTIDEVTNAYKALNAEASNITKNFSRQLSPIDSAIRSLAKGEETISGLRAEFKGLNNAPKEINSELNKCARLLKNVKKIEAQEGRTENWSQAYRQWSDSLDTLQAKLKTLRKEQSNVASTQVFNTSDLKNNNIAYMSKVYNTIEKQMVEINRLAKAKNWQVVDVSGIEQADGKIKKLTLTIRDAEGALKKFDMQREKLRGNGKSQYGLMQIGDVKVLETASKAQEKLAQSTEKSNSKLAEQINRIQNLTNGIGIKNDYTTQIAKLEGQFRSLGLSEDEISKKTSRVTSAFEALKSRVNQPLDSSNYQEIITLNDTLQRELSESANEYTKLHASAKGMASEQQRLTLANTIEAWNQKNSAATKKAREENERYIASLRDLSTQMTRTEYSRINTAFKQTENSMRALNKLGASLKNQMSQAASSFGTWLSASTAVMKVVSETREALVNIKDMDNTLTEISKTSDMTAESLEKLGIVSYNVASKYGRTASDYLSAYESMARSGFYNEIGEEMAEISLLAQAAGDMSQEIADNYIIAMNAVYKYNGDAEKLNNALDGMNTITNRNSVALEDMAEAMSKAGATASSYNVRIEDLSAMIGTMEAVTKSGGEEVGNSLKSILINLQNVTSSKITNTLEKANASMTTFVDGVEKLRNPIDILRDLAKTFNALDEDDTLRAEILTNIGGKYQANKLSALLQNMDLFDKMLVDYSEGSGSALEEASKSANNLTGRLNTLQNSWNKLINTLVTSEGLKSGVNFLNGLVQGVTKSTESLGTLGTIGLGAGLFAGIKNAG